MIWSLAIRATGLANRLWTIARAYPMQAAIIALVCLSVWLWQGKRGANERADRATATLKADRALYTAAQEEAKARAIAAVKAQEARYQEQAANADQSHRQALETAYSALDRYIAANRVRAKAVDRASVGTGEARESDRAESSDGPGGTADMVAVTADDLRICTVNTQRLVAVKAWADGL